jgi:hypothetical protein
MPKFIPDKLVMSGPRVPYFEDSSSDNGVAGHSTRKSILDLQNEIRQAIGRLGGGVQDFIPGQFDTVPIRYGYSVTFMLGDMPGRIDVAGLPIKYQHTGKKKEAALKQALYMLRDMLEAQYYGMLVMPDSQPLVPYLLGTDGRTVTEALADTGDLPMVSRRPQVDAGRNGDVLLMGDGRL